ncbi:two-component sensor histidine kinase [Virgibacillus phasianinus]|uniref:Sensor histidine kinase n=1 Tax=Virgibacillus phasianinus TaxID=2017483 RepID=A0A220U3V4_9BACI|nr:sensor histidine kinase [Virgibacillus phasianinus]ASK62787.1 two-component sensor histidine kinase [Virgibacillus phasianinus]
MNIVLRHIVTAVLFSFLVSIVIIGITLIVFPLDNFALLFNRKIADIPYVFVISLIPITAGLIIGISTGSYWRQRLHRIDRQLDELVKGQKLTTDDESYKELQAIQMRINQVQEKFRVQAEQSQRMVTERANEREKSLQEVVVQERNRLARELHDSVSQQLFAASMMMSAINEEGSSDEQTRKRQLGMVENMIHQSQLEMRALLLHLRPVALKGQSLQEGVEELLLELRQKVPMKIEWKVEQFQVEKGVEDQLFRILQESVSNTLRHAKATTLDAMLIERDDSVILRIVDNGIGFNVERVRASSYGIQNMSERANEIGGTCKIISLPNEGTRVEVKIPRVKKEDESDD